MDTQKIENLENLCSFKYGYLGWLSMFSFQGGVIYPDQTYET